MAWPTPAIRLLGTDIAGPANPDTATVTFPAQVSGTLLVAFATAGRGGPFFNPPSGGWTLLDEAKFASGTTDPSFAVWAKVSDGTETSYSVTGGSISVAFEMKLFVIAIESIDGLSAFSGHLDQAVHRSTHAPSFTMPYAPDTIVTVGSPDIRLDIVCGYQALASAFEAVDPGLTIDLLDIEAANGTANRGALSAFATIVGGAGGGSIIGPSYDAENNAVAGVFSLLLNIRLAGWKINEMGMA